MPLFTREERETLIRWDDGGDTATVYSASPVVKRQLERKGYVFRELSPQSWVGEVPKRAVGFRRLVGGRLPKRPASGGLARQKGFQRKVADEPTPE